MLLHIAQQQVSHSRSYCSITSNNHQVDTQVLKSGQICGLHVRRCDKEKYSPSTDNLYNIYENACNSISHYSYRVKICLQKSLYQSYEFILQNVRPQCGQFRGKNGNTESAFTWYVFRRKLAGKILPSGKICNDFFPMSRFKKTLETFLAGPETTHFFVVPFLIFSLEYLSISSMTPTSNVAPSSEHS